MNKVRKYPNRVLEYTVSVKNINGMVGGNQKLIYSDTTKTNRSASLLKCARAKGTRGEWRSERIKPNRNRKKGSQVTELH